MQAGHVLRFAPFHLDPVNARLWRGSQLIALTPKAFTVLCHLVEHAGQLVTKDVLLTAVWPEIYVSEGVLSECVREIRKALGDTPQAPRFIQTAHRRGYRFIGKVVSSQQSVASRRKQRGGNWQLTTQLVGRETELAQLQKWLKRALDGARQLVFVTGEAGIGKTTLIDAFLQHLGASVPGPEKSQTAKVKTQKSKIRTHILAPSPQPLAPVFIGRGQCIDHYGQGEAYLPVLEALGRMCREPEGNQLIDLLAQHAPTWLVQMPALLTTTDLESLQRRTQGATRERMLRELAEAMEVLTTERPLVLWLEDLQWSDVSTLDWLAFVARRREPARLLIIGAYRPVEVIVSNHVLKSVKQELQLHEQCVELPLSFLTEEDVSKYLESRFASLSPASAGKSQGQGLAPATLHKLTHLIHQRTEGNPLFMVNLVDYLVTQGVLARIDGQWRLQGEVTAVESWAPESLQQMIEKQIERLSPAEKRVLEVASVAGVEFSAAVVAAGAGIEVEAVEEQCSELVRQGQLLRAGGTAEWPDGTVAARYGFLHALYQEVLYQRLTVRRRQRLHRQLGERLETAYGPQAGEIAAELALHFEQGRDYHKAIQYLRRAGARAAQRSAYAEAIAHLTKGLEALKPLPDTPERARQELTLQVTLGAALIATKGYGAPEVEKAYTRARVLCQRVGETPQLFPVLWGLWAFYNARAELQAAHELAEQCLHLAQRVQDPGFLLEAYVALGLTLFWRGEFAPARAHLERGIALYDPSQHRSHAFLYGQDPGVWCLSFAARALYELGYPDRALKRADEALTLAQELAHPLSLASALVFAGLVHLLRREGQLSQKYAEALITLATEQGFPYWVAYGTLLQGWALAEQGQSEEGIVQMRQNWAATQATGSGLFRPYFLARLAEAYGIEGQTEEGLNTVAEALVAVDKTGERVDEAELYRIKGMLTLQQERERATGNGQQGRVTDPRPLTPDSQSEAEACFLKAIEIALRQQAKSLELRATVSLARLWQQQRKKKQARKMLAEIYNWFTEGVDTKDLQEAKALLAELSH